MPDWACPVHSSGVICLDVGYRVSVPREVLACHTHASLIAPCRGQDNILHMPTHKAPPPPNLLSPTITRHHIWSTKCKRAVNIAAADGDSATCERSSTHNAFTGSELCRLQMHYSRWWPWPISCQLLRWFIPYCSDHALFPGVKATLLLVILFETTSKFVKWGIPSHCLEYSQGAKRHNNNNNNNSVCVYVCVR